LSYRTAQQADRLVTSVGEEVS